MIVHDRDGEVIAQGARLPVGGKPVPDAHVRGACRLDGPRDDKDLGEPNGADGAIERDHLRARGRIILY